jgi:hypothetical protein
LENNVSQSNFIFRSGLTLLKENNSQNESDRQAFSKCVLKTLRLAMPGGPGFA